MAWIFSSSCSGPLDSLSSSADVSLFSKTQEWIAYILFSQCSQHSIAAATNLTFIVVAAWLNLRFPRAWRVSHSGIVAGWSFIVILLCSSALCLASAGIAACDIWNGTEHGWFQSTIRETIFSAVECSAWITSGAVLFMERNTCAFLHPMPLRIWWFLSFLLSAVQILSSIFRLSAAGGLSYGLLLGVFDIYALAKFPIFLFFLFTALQGETSLRTGFIDDNDKLEDPLIKKAHIGTGLQKSSFSEAGFLSKITFSWLNPLLFAGSKQSLEIFDVPSLATKDRAEHTFCRLQENWPKAMTQQRPMTVALLKTFWVQIVRIGSLQIIRIAVIYAGPMLITSFTNYSTGDRVSVYDGYALVFILLVAKLLEVFSYHHFNFLSYKLGNNMRTAIITTVYRKGLRLSSSSRQRHGVGQITNYMVVDAQQISDACLQLHQWWCILVQVILGMVLLWIDIGIASLAGLTVMVLVAILTVFNGHSQRAYMSKVMTMRDTRMRSITEVLAYMKVIKLEAWEEKFRQQVETIRQTELTSLTKFVFLAAENMFTLWNTASFVSTVTFVTAVLINADLTTAKVFTANAIFRIVQEPIRNFPQSVNALSQVLVSLERLNKYMLSSELDRGAVHKSLVVCDWPIFVDKGFFAWDDAQETPTLKDINLKVGQGSLVTIVGTIGSGKSSLLAALLGEMVKVSGKVISSSLVTNCHAY